jgi:hypothetical protein
MKQTENRYNARFHGYEEVLELGIARMTTFIVNFHDSFSSISYHNTLTINYIMVKYPAKTIETPLIA